MDNYYKLQEEEAGEWSGGWADQMIEALCWYINNYSRHGDTLLDIGCNTGRSLYHIRDNYPNINAFGVDLIKSKIESAKEKGLNAIEMDMHNLKFSDKSFNLVFMSHVIEHSLDPKKVIAEAIRVAKNYVFIICPIEDHKQDNTPHTSPFLSVEEWLATVDEVAKGYLILNEEKNRLGKEIWTIIVK